MTNDPVRVYYDADADRGRLSGRTFAIIGYGSQGHAHALNLRDSGAQVIVGLRPGGGSLGQGQGRRPRRARRSPRRPPRPTSIMMLVPDQDGAGRSTRAAWPRGSAPGKTLMFAHGFNIHYGEIAPPAGRGRLHGGAQVARATWCGASSRPAAGVPGLVAVHQDASGQALANALAYAAGHRLHPGGRDRDLLPRGDRDRPLRRAGGALRRRHGAGEGRASRR